MKVTWVVRGAPEARITVYADDGRELGEPEVQRVAEQNVLVLYPTTRDITIATLAPPGTAFPAGSDVQLRVLTSHPPEESDLVVCTPVDVGGLTRSVVLQLRCDGDEAVVSVPESGQHAEVEHIQLAPRPDGAEVDSAAPLGAMDAVAVDPDRVDSSGAAPSALSHAASGTVSLVGYERRQRLIRGACAAARIGIDRQRAQENDLRRIVVVLDRSASMVTGLRNGSVEAVLAVLTGVAEVFGTRSAEVWTIDAQTASPVGRLTPQSLLECQDSAYALLSTGMSLEPLRQIILSEVSEPTLLYLVTDGAPTDSDGIVEALSRLDAASVPVVVHVIALATSGADFRRSTPPDPAPADPLGDFRPAAAGGQLRLTAIGPSLPNGLLEELSDESVLRRLVGALVPMPERVDLPRPSATTNSGASVS